MKHFYLLLFFLLSLSLDAANKYNVRVLPEDGEYASIAEALGVCNDNPSDRDTISVVGVFTGKVTVNKSVVIIGEGWDESIIQAFENAPEVGTPPATKSNVIVVSPGKTVDFISLSIRHGYTPNTVPGGGINITNNNGGKVTLNKVKVYNNYSEGASGGIAIIGSSVDIIDSYIVGNRSTTLGGGGIHITSNNSGSDSRILVKGSTIAENITANVSGGGVSIDGNGTNGNKKMVDLIFENSTIVFNRSGGTGAGFHGKGVPFTGTPSATTNVRLSFNHCTIAHNSVDVLGASTLAVGLGFANVTTGYPSLDMHNTVVTMNNIQIDETTSKSDMNFNRSAPDSITNCIFGSTVFLLNASTNINNKAGCFEAVKLDNQLRNKGGVVPVLPILSGSIAIDSVITSYLPVTFDQRGFARDIKSDVGSYEFKKIESITISTYKNLLGLNSGYPDTTLLQVNYSPLDSDSTFFKFQIENADLLSVNDTTRILTPLTIGESNVVGYSQDNPTLNSIPISIIVVNGTTTSTNEINKKDIVDLISNPFGDILIFKNPENIKEIIVRNLNGSILYQGRDNSGVDLTHLSDGTYLITVKTIDNKVVNRLAIKKS